MHLKDELIRKVEYAIYITLQVTTGEEREDWFTTYDKSVELAMFGDNVFDDLGSHSGITDIEQHGVADAAQFLDFILNNI